MFQMNLQLFGGRGGSGGVGGGGGEVDGRELALELYENRNSETLDELWEEFKELVRDARWAMRIPNYEELRSQYNYFEDARAFLIYADGTTAYVGEDYEAADMNLRRKPVYISLSDGGAERDSLGYNSDVHLTNIDTWPEQHDKYGEQVLRLFREREKGK